MKNNLSIVPFLLTVAVLLGSGVAVAKSVLHFAEQAQEQEFAGAKSSRQLNVHFYGYQIKVLNPGLNPQRDRVVRIRDLGPTVSNLQKDLDPTAAKLTVNSHPALDLLPNSQGELEAIIPASWLSLITDNTASLTVFHNQKTLNKISLEGMFF
jgi:hypothetical protein